MSRQIGSYSKKLQDAISDSDALPFTPGQRRVIIAGLPSLNFKRESIAADAYIAAVTVKNHMQAMHRAAGTQASAQLLHWTFSRLEEDGLQSYETNAGIYGSSRHIGRRLSNRLSLSKGEIAALGTTVALGSFADAATRLDKSTKTIGNQVYSVGRKITKATPESFPVTTVATSYLVARALDILPVQSELVSLQPMLLDAQQVPELV